MKIDVKENGSPFYGLFLHFVDTFANTIAVIFLLDFLHVDITTIDIKNPNDTITFVKNKLPFDSVANIIDNYNVFLKDVTVAQNGIRIINYKQLENYDFI